MPVKDSFQRQPVECKHSRHAVCTREAMLRWGTLNFPSVTPDYHKLHSDQAGSHTLSPRQPGNGKKSFNKDFALPSSLGNPHWLVSILRSNGLNACWPRQWWLLFLWQHTEAQWLTLRLSSLHWLPCLLGGGFSLGQRAHGQLKLWETVWTENPDCWGCPPWEGWNCHLEGKDQRRKK